MAILDSGNSNINIDGAVTDYTDFGGSDTYTILASLSADVTIIDNNASTINLPAGMDITAATFLADGVQFTVNGNTVTFLGDPSLFSFVFGGTPLDPTAGTPLSFADTAVAFGTTVPAAGDPANTASNTGVIEDDGSVGDGTPPPSGGGGTPPTSPGDILVLTKDADNIMGSELDDVINGVVEDDDDVDSPNTFGPGDIIDGGDGLDTLRITHLYDADNFGDGFGAGATVNNVEILQIVQAYDTDGDFDLGGFTGLEQIVTEHTSDDSYEFYNLQEELVSVTFDESGASQSDRGGSFYLYDIDNSLYTADDDILTINLNHAGSSESGSSYYFSVSNAAGDEVFEGYNINVEGDDNYLYIDTNTNADGDDIAATVVISGDGSLELDMDEEEALESVDASALTGGLIYALGDTVEDQEIAITGGEGDDDIIMDEGILTIMTGAGDDRVELDFTGLTDDDQGDDILDGGDDTDTLAGDVDAWADAEFADLTISNFEIMELSAASAGAATVDSDGFDEVIISANLTGGGDLEIENTAGKTVTFEENTQSTNALIFSSTGSADELSLSFEDEASGTLADLQLVDIEMVDVSTSTADDDITLTTVDVSGVEMLSFTGEGDIDIDGVTDDGSLETLDISGVEGTFTNDGAGLDVTALTEVMVGNGGVSEIEFAADYDELITFGSDLENDIVLDQIGVGVGGVVLDLSGLDVSGFADLDVVFTAVGAGMDTLDITSDDFDGTIQLVGTYSGLGDLDGAANFMFA